MFPPRGGANVIEFSPRVRTVPPSAAPNHIPPEYRDRHDVTRDIDRHIEASRAYRIGVAWLVAAEEQKLPQANIEAALADVRRLYEEMVEAARSLVICMPTDLKALCDLTMYLEKNFTSLPAEIIVADGGGRGGAPRIESLAFHLLRTMRLSLRTVAKYGKYDGCRDDD